MCDNLNNRPILINKFYVWTAANLVNDDRLKWAALI